MRLVVNKTVLIVDIRISYFHKHPREHDNYPNNIP